MAQERWASTLPRNFQYHDYSGNDMFKTPERDIGPQPEHASVQPPRPQRYNVSTPAELNSSAPARPQRYQLRRMGRRSRLNIDRAIAMNLDNDEEMVVPTIEIPDSNDTGSTENSLQSSITSPGLLQPFVHSRPALPRTPSPQPEARNSKWISPARRRTIGEDFARPNESISYDSSSSEDSDMDSDDGMSYGGSCTSPESEVGSIYSPSRKLNFPSTKLTFGPESPIVPTKGKAPEILWTTDMDNHLWACYMKYLNDPTVTPFKSWPGSAPPLGVCRRVAREAKRTWKGPKALANSTEKIGIQLGRNDSTDTITALRSGSNTPVRSAATKIPAWPKSGKHTRRRFRELCKRKTSIAPHYQRMLKSRSPEPMSSGGRSSHRPRLSSPELFSTREVRLSLATSTAATMQPTAPMAQLSAVESSRGHARSTSWFNDPSVAWASPAPVPSSEMHRGQSAAPQTDNQPEVLDKFNRFSSDPPRLGSPFMYNTWTSGNQRTRRNLRPLRDSNSSASAPRLRSPFELRGTFPYPSKQKRRAQAPLEQELSPSGSDRRQVIETDVFGGPIEPVRRRVRARGFSYGDALTQGRLPTTHTPPPEIGPQTIHRFSTPAAQLSFDTSYSLAPPPPRDAPIRLGSPFVGIGSRPTRSRRQMTPTPLVTWNDHDSFPSIESTLDQRKHERADSF